MKMKKMNIDYKMSFVLLLTGLINSLPLLASDNNSNNNNSQTTNDSQLPNAEQQIEVIESVIDNLPIEVLTKILSHITVKDIMTNNLNTVSSKFYEVFCIITKIEHKVKDIFNKMCENWNKLQSDSSSGLSPNIPVIMSALKISASNPPSFAQEASLKAKAILALIPRTGINPLLTRKLKSSSYYENLFKEEYKKVSDEIKNRLKEDELIKNYINKEKLDL